MFQSMACAPVRSLALAAFVAVAALASATTVSAQSSTRYPGSSTRIAEKVALDGYCPVCIVKMKQWVRGKSQYQARYDGKNYYFPSSKERDMFLADPASFVPALGGDCTVCLAKMGKRMAGSVHHSALYQNRLYLFPGRDQREEFLANPAAFADVDLAMGGKCAVCLTHMKKEVPGKPEFTAVHQGMRYLFPSTKERDMFLKNPAQYAKPAGAESASITARKETLVTVHGTSGCAGCSHGITPLKASDTLGLAVNTPDGRIFVVEDAHTLYPSVYKNRYDELRLEVSGQVVKRRENITWIQPSQLRVLQ